MSSPLPSRFQSSVHLAPGIAPGSARSLTLPSHAPRWTRRSLLGVMGSLLAIGLVSCRITGSSPQEPRKPRVVATSTILADLTHRIGQDAIDLQGILKPGDDPHTYEPIPRDTVTLEKADLVLYNGYNLEPGLIRLMQANALKAKKVPVGEVVTPLKLDKEGERVPDPHVWGNAQNAMRMVTVIRDELIKLQPHNRDRFTQNAQALLSELQRLDRWIAAQIQTLPPEKRKLVTTHDAFQYYAQAYGLTVVGTLIGISTEEQPSAQTVKQLVQAIRSSGVPTIFAETAINPALIETVAEEAKVQLAEKPLFADSIGVPGEAGDSYVDMLVVNTQLIVQGLGGTVQEFPQDTPRDTP
ncbi:metal ABC transporter solute-binding protein, Zn/Mn family [Alkalinema pantanalense CENA528]|uniref:metal ABC transporter solute-binding protein, Zn/Mn family n=1 Tax=Alkalinema pantanalense TaxID=1620705 RepID=UPI003D701746